jgi:hypothetical protein
MRLAGGPEIRNSLDRLKRLKNGSRRALMGQFDIRTILIETPPGAD